jgi:hypothetical protein
MVKIVNELKGDEKRAEGKLVWRWISPCNCGENVNHNDGGFYHKVLYFYRFEFPNVDIFVMVESDTRDFFSEEKKYVLYKDYILLELKEWEEVIFKEIVEY